MFDYHKWEKTGDFLTLVLVVGANTEFADLFDPHQEEEHSLERRVDDYVKQHRLYFRGAIKIVLGTLTIATLWLDSPPPVEAATSITVQQGDSLYFIATRNGTTVERLMAANQLASTTIYPGQTLLLPPLSVYTVQAGDTLYLLAKRFQLSIQAIQQYNQLTSSTIYVGQKLYLTEPVAKRAFHRVVAGDQLPSIAAAYTVTIEQLKQWNSLSSDVLFVGQVLRVAPPAAPTITTERYTIKSGDTIWGLSVQFGIPQTELLAANKLTMTSPLSVGQSLLIPQHTIPVQAIPTSTAGEYLDWWTEAQYVVPINAVMTVTDCQTAVTFHVKRTIGANHSDTEPLTAQDTALAKQVWGGFSWSARPVLVRLNGRQLAASMSFYPHGIEYIANNDFNGHFDLHFRNSTRHVDGQIDEKHQLAVKQAAGLIPLP